MNILEANFVEVTGWRLWLLKKMGFLGFTFFNGTVWLRPESISGGRARVCSGAVWAKCYEILGEVEAGTRTAPTVAELLAEIASTTTTLTPESGQ